jgi:transporter family-2 protein
MPNRALWLLATIAGAILACMLFYNGMLAHATDPIWASFVAHGVGTAAALLLLALPVAPRKVDTPATAPLWAYLGGVPGALTVILANITVNTPLGLTGSLSLMLLGQVVFALIVDSLGWFQLQPRRPGLYDFASVLGVMSGSAILIFFAR